MLMLHHAAHKIRQIIDKLVSDIAKISGMQRDVKKMGIKSESHMTAVYSYTKN